MAHPDYPTELYYCLSVMGPVYKDGAEAGWIGDDNMNPDGICGGWAEAQITLPYDPNAEYYVLSSHSVQAMYRHFNESAFEDQFNYAAYGVMDPSIHFPGWFNFSGDGPSVSGLQNIFLGTIYTIFTGGAASGPPHHLKVVSDQQITGTCGQKQRFVTYKIVDSTGKKAGGVPIKEIFPGTIIDSCSNKEVKPTQCNAWADLFTGNFTDQIFTGCPSQQGNCGFTIADNRWAWCSTIGITVLARVRYDVGYSSISINGDASSWAGAEFYP
jgi:hypothetical protein